VRRWADGVGLVVAFGVGLVSGVFGVGGGWALVPVFNLVMGLPLKVAVACSEVAIALGDAAAAAATYLSAGLRPDFLVSTQVGARVAAGIVRLGFAFRRGYAGRLYGGVLLTVAAAGVFLPVVGVAECGFSPRRLWWPSSRRRCGVEIGAAVLLALFLAVLAAG